MVVMLLCSVAYATEIAIVEPPMLDNIPLGVSSLDELPLDPPPYSDLDTNALLEVILSRIDFVLFMLCPIALAILVVYLGCRWFLWTFFDGDYFQ